MLLRIVKSPSILDLRKAQNIPIITQVVIILILMMIIETMVNAIVPQFLIKCRIELNTYKKSKKISNLKACFAVILSVELGFNEDIISSKKALSSLLISFAKSQFVLNIGRTSPDSEIEGKLFK
ncbi:hypothetical protein [Cryptosporidium hominis TU502]|uniref:hypothetical protein n=1 Tax=Cryptosporidium hominis (strain TU502) TaxID=353151 RepID=UPI0000452E05|nr:hypothetical protein [Cryptosporidium hominis TU502]